MMDEYAPYVLSAYAASLVLLGALVLRSWTRARAARRTLDKLEQKR